MNEEKSKNLKTALIVAATTLMFILILVVTFQVVSLVRTHNRIKALEEEEKRLSEENAEYGNEIDKWVSEWKIKERARERGWLFPGDK